MNNSTRPTGKPLSAVRQPKTVSSQRAMIQTQGVQRPIAINQAGHGIIAPPVYRPQPATKVLQAKLHGSPQSWHSRPAMKSSSGIVQANVIGGTHALQARLNLWNTRLGHGSSCFEEISTDLLLNAWICSAGEPGIPEVEPRLKSVSAANNVCLYDA